MSSLFSDPREDFSSEEEELEEEDGGEVISSSLLPSLVLKKPAGWGAVKKVAGGPGNKKQSLGMEFIQNLNENVSLAEAARKRQEALDRGRSKSVDPILPSMLNSHSYSGAFRLNSLRRTMDEERRSIVERNPAAFQMEIGLVEEAEYRSRAELARMKFEEMKKSISNEHCVDSWRSSMRSLRNARPYFLPPVVSKEHAKRLNVDEQRAIAAKMGRDSDAEEAALNEKKANLLKSASDNWNVKESRFWERRAENEARSIFETDAIRNHQFSIDWARVVEKTRFRRYVGMEDKGVKSGGKLDQELGEIREEVFKVSNELRFIFSYYSSVIDIKFSSDSVLQMTFQPWREFCRESGVVSIIQLRDLENIFVAVNFEEANNNTAESKANDDDSMMRFEFIEGIVRAAFHTYINTGLMTDASDATEKFVREIVIPGVPAEALVDPNTWRQLRLYTYDMDRSLTTHWELLSAIFKLYKARDKTKYFAIEHWGTLLDQAQLLNSHTKLERKEAKLIFVWSQIMVADELKRRKRAVGLVFFDFVEAIARVADFISPLSTEELLGMRPVTLTKRASVVGVRRRHTETPTDLPPSIPEGEADDDADILALVRPRGRPESAGLMTVPGKTTRGLHVKFDFLCEYLGHQMISIWGGKDLEECIERMNKTAKMLSGGTELG